MGRGVLLSLLVGLLLVFGILWPVFEAFFSPELIRGSSWSVVIFAFACAVAFYFGGMISGYHAPNRNVLHGILVAPITFLISPAINLATGKGAFPEVETTLAAALIGVFLIVATTAALVGGRRGAALSTQNQTYLSRRQAARKVEESRLRTDDSKSSS